MNGHTPGILFISLSRLGAPDRNYEFHTPRPFRVGPPTSTHKFFAAQLNRRLTAVFKGKVTGPIQDDAEITKRHKEVDPVVTGTPTESIGMENGHYQTDKRG